MRTWIASKTPDAWLNHVRLGKAKKGLLTCQPVLEKPSEHAEGPFSQLRAADPFVLRHQCPLAAAAAAAVAAVADRPPSAAA